MKQIVERHLKLTLIRCYAETSNVQHQVTGNTKKHGTSWTIFLRSILEKIALFMSNCAVHVKNRQFRSSEYLKYSQVRDPNLDRKEGFYALKQRVYCRKIVKNMFYRTQAYYNLQVEKYALNANALKQGACQSKTAENWHATKTLLQWAGHRYVAVKP